MISRKALVTNIRLSKAQFSILMSIREGSPFCEYLMPTSTFRTLGADVPARLNYVLDGKHVGYRTFWVLFKYNFIRPSKARKLSPSPQNGVTRFYLTERGLEATN